VRAQDLIIVVTSVGTEEQALDIAHALIRNRQAACVNIVSQVHSIYRWKGRVCDDREMLLIIKTVGREYDGVRATIQKVNTYELPEVLAYRVDHASPSFAAWISRMTDRPKKRGTAKGSGARAAASPRRSVAKKASTASL
jgi:periplasmic divalent cation tolerance protein